MELRNLATSQLRNAVTRRDFGKGLAAILAAGVAPALSGAATGGLRRGLGMRLAGMGGGKSGPALPAGYRRVQYLETTEEAQVTKGAYIDTGFPINDKMMTLEMDIQLTSVSQNDMKIMGAFCGYSVLIYNGKWRPLLGGGFVNDTPYDFDRHTFVLTNNKVEIDGEPAGQISSTWSPSWNYYNCYLFGQRYNQYNVDSRAGKRVFSCSLKDASGELLFDAIPIANENDEGAMFDLVTNQIMPWTRTGTIIVGPDFT